MDYYSSPSLAVCERKQVGARIDTTVIGMEDTSSECGLINWVMDGPICWENTSVKAVGAAAEGNQSLFGSVLSCVAKKAEMWYFLFLCFLFVLRDQDFPLTPEEETDGQSFDLLSASFSLVKPCFI